MPKLFKILDVADARVALAAELGCRTGNKAMIMAYDDMVRSGIATVFVTDGDDDDERVILRIRQSPAGESEWLAVLDEGVTKIGPIKAPH